MKRTQYSLVFGKRDAKKYQAVIAWLSQVDEGWINEEIKDALLFYVQHKEEVNISTIQNFNSQPIHNQETKKPIKEFISIPKTNQNTTVENSPTEETNDIEDNIDKFLGDSF